jgi:hypothetical protein
MTRLLIRRLWPFAQWLGRPLAYRGRHSAIKEMRSYKTLGVLFNEHLTLNDHVEHLISKLNKGLFMINRVKNLLPGRALKSIYSTTRCFIHTSSTVLSYYHAHPTATLKKSSKYKKKPSAQSLTHHTTHTLPHSLHTIKFSHTLRS